MSLQFAPWTAEEVKSLNEFQQCDAWHPFTCGKCRANLVATALGWRCNTFACDYIQDWAHDWMANGKWRENPMIQVLNAINKAPENPMPSEKPAEATITTGTIHWLMTGTQECSNCCAEFDVLFKKGTILRIPDLVFCPMCGMVVTVEVQS